MNKIDFCLDLNERQSEAVQTPSQYVRVVAGAGSGKTRVLTYRIAYLIKEMDVVPWKILAFTFTNKVAKEMQDRVINIVPEASKHLTIKTLDKNASFVVSADEHGYSYQHFLFSQPTGKHIFVSHNPDNPNQQNQSNDEEFHT